MTSPRLGRPPAMPSSVPLPSRASSAQTIKPLSRLREREGSGAERREGEGYVMRLREGDIPSPAAASLRFAAPPSPASGRGAIRPDERPADDRAALAGPRAAAPGAVWQRRRVKLAFKAMG